METWLGIDLGSISTKAVLVDKNKNIVNSIYIRSKDTESSLREILNYLIKDEIKIKGVGVTGSGREFAKNLINADLAKTEIIAHAIGNIHYQPKVRTIIDIGGEDSKLILLQDGIMRDFNMNTVCLSKDTNITINNFIQKPIHEIKIGEKVLTHKGKFKKVTRIFERNYHGKILKINCDNLRTLKITPEHPLFALKREDVKYYNSKEGKIIIWKPYKEYKYVHHTPHYRSKRYKQLNYEPKFIPAKELKKGDFVAIPLAIYGNEINMLNDKNFQVKKENNRRGEQFFKYKNYLFLPIKNVIEDDYNDKVYNLEIRDNNSYIANLLSVHNCSAGMGACMENIAIRLGIEIEEFGSLALKANKIINLPMKCGVLMSSAVVSAKNKGERIEDILMGVTKAVARNFLSICARGKDLETPIIFCGMTAHNKALHKALQDEIGKNIFIPKNPELMGAFGIALLTAEEMDGRQTSFNNHFVINKNYKIIHHREDCIACGNCFTNALGYFIKDKDGKSKCIKEEVEKEDLEDLKMICKNCPKQLITLKGI